jgi:molybdenum cofactor biosynthesis protein B
MTQIPDLHKATAPKSLGIYIVTCSTSKFIQRSRGENADDVSGDIIERMTIRAGHRTEGRMLISDSKPMIKKVAKKAFALKHVDALIITGGTGLSPRDVTVESISPIIEKAIPGFGELFRRLSYEKIGSAAMLSRAFAGFARGKAVFCLPGSPDAVETAMEKLILPELGHIVRVGREH